MEEKPEVRRKAGPRGEKPDIVSLQAPGLRDCSAGQLSTTRVATRTRLEGQRRRGGPWEDVGQPKLEGPAGKGGKLC